MPKKYVCELCKKEFNQKGDYTKHKSKKSPCVSIEQIEQLIQTTGKKKDIKTELVNVFKTCLNILRDNEGLTGDKALRTMSFLLILKLIEPHFGNEIDIDDCKYYDFSYMDEKYVDNHKNTLFKIARFSNLAIEPDENIPKNMKYLWDDVLSKHPTTKHIFSTGKGFDIQRASTYKKLVDKINSVDLTSTDLDILGNAYEEVIQDIMKGKVLGQFFTPPEVKKIMVKLIDPQIHKDGTIDTCGDPTMGTGGFLITYLKYVLQQAALKGIKPNWEFIKTEGLYGKELEPDTYQLAVSNLLISSGHMFDRVEKGDSIRTPITKKFDNVLANPPFGIKGLKYDDFESANKNEYLPIKSDNAVSLFIQVIIYILKVNGKGAMVVPDGQDLFSKTNKTLVTIREFLLKTCDLKEVIYFPAGLFNNTTIKTAVLFFVKKKEGGEVLTINSKVTRAKKETRTYEFTKPFQTTNVKFYDYNPANETKTLLVEVSMDQLKQTSYSLNYTEYIIKEEKPKIDIVIDTKKLHEICDIDYGTRIVKASNTEGNYSVYGSGRAMFTTNEYNREGFNILIGRFALSPECVRFVNEKIFLNDSGLSIKPKDETIVKQKYIGYYALLNQNLIYDCARGTAQKNLEMEIFKSLEIPVPSIEFQNEIVEYLDFIYEQCIKTSQKKIAELRKLNEYKITNQIAKGMNEEKTLDDLCEFKNGKSIKRENLVKGEYYVIGGGQKPMGYHNEYNTNEETILCSSSGSAGFISKYPIKVWASDCFSIIPKNIEELNNSYLYYYLKNVQDEIYKLQTGTAQPHVYSSDIKNLKILVPSMGRQKDIVEYCEHNDKLIKDLEAEIERNKEEAKAYLDMVCFPEEGQTIHEPADGPQ